ncbi:LamG domain-containing protein, partial [Candidatus Woesearchaeota archaeon]|nr:LamG domain-containing protein [Candidatus Woesearchaeota archaeon]
MSAQTSTSNITLDFKINDSQVYITTLTYEREKKPEEETKEDKEEVVKNIEIRLQDKAEKPLGKYKITKKQNKHRLELSTKEEQTLVGRFVTLDADQAAKPEGKVIVEGISEIPQGYTAKFDDIADKRIKTKVFAAESLTFENATLTLPKTGEVNAVLKCDDFDVTSFTCSKWRKTEIPFVDSGDSITFTVTSFSGYAGGFINITKADHLDANKNVISNIFEQAKALDGVWTETIPADDYVRVVFESTLTSQNDITVYPRTVSGNPKIKIYEQDGTQVIAEFTSLNDNVYNKVYLTSLSGTQDTFDLFVYDGSLEFDHIIDPNNPPNAPTLNAPANNSIAKPGFRLLNLTVTDPEGDLMNVSIYGNNLSASKLIAYLENIANGTTLTYNWTAPTASSLYLADRSIGSYYPFDFNASDSAKGLTGTLSGNAFINKSAGKLGGALQLDGTLDYVEVAADQSFNFSATNNFTVAAWIYSVGSLNLASIAGKWDGNQGGRQWRFGTETSKLYLAISNDGFTYSQQTDPTTLLADRWYHVAATWDNGAYGIYVNGIKTSSGTSGVTSLLKSSTRNLCIGGVDGTNSDTCDVSQEFNGTIDELILLNRSLSAGEILNLYRLGDGTYHWKATADDGASSTTSATNQFNVENTPPYLPTLNSPADATFSSDTFRLLNVTVSDYDSDIMNVSIYASNTTAANDLVSTTKNAASGTEITYNLTALPISTLFPNDPALVGYWKLDNNGTDTTGINNATTILGNPVFNSSGGKIGGSYKFDAVGDYINIPASASLNITTGKVTLAAWINVVNDAGYKEVILKRSGNPTQYALRIDPNEKLVFFWYNGGWRQPASPSAVPTGQWIHVAGTRDDTTNTVVLYVNGVNVTTDTSITQDMIPNNINVWLGSAFNGDIDEAVIFNRILSQAEILKIYKLGNETYYWKTIADDGTAINTSATKQFTVGADTIPPLISFVAPTPSNGSSVSQNYIEANITSSDPSGIATSGITIFLYNSGGVVSQPTSSTSPFFNNFTGLSDGTYYVNSTSYDNLMNMNYTETRTIIINTNQAPSAPTLNSPANASTDTATFSLLNVTVTDPEADAMNVSIYGDNTTSASSLLAYFQNVANGSTLTYNWAAPTASHIFGSDPSLVGYWNFDKNASDFSGDDNHGTLVGGAILNTTKGKFGGALDLNGNGQYVNVSDSAELGVYTNFTVSMWLYDKSTTNDRILEKGNAYFIANDMGEDLCALGRWQFFVKVSSTIYCVGSPFAHNTNQWYHVVGVKNDSHISIFIDGILENSLPMSETINDNNLALIIGGDDEVTKFNGTIDDVAIFNRTLSATEIFDLYKLKNQTYHWKATADDGTTTTTSATNQFILANPAPNIPILNSPANSTTDTATFRLLNITVSDPDGDGMSVSIYGDNTTSAGQLLAYSLGVANATTLTYNWTSPTIGQMFGSDPSLVGYWNLDKNTFDFSGDENHGVLVGGATINTTRGKFGGALDLSGTDQYISVADSVELGVVNNFTVSMWLYDKSATNDRILEKGDGYFFMDNINAIGTCSTGDWEMLVKKSNTNYCVGSASAHAQNQWYHVVGRKNDTHISLFVNGVHESSVALSGNIDDDNLALIIGGDDSGIEFNGVMDDIAIFNRSLSNSEILDLYRLQNATYYWKATADDGSLSTTSATNQFTVGATPNQAPSAPTLNSPTNATTVSTNPSLRLLNITVSDAEADAMNVSIYGDNSSASNLIAFFSNVANGTTLTYNFTSLPVGALYSTDTNLVGYWRMDKNVSDFSGRNQNGALYGNAFINTTGGYLGGGLQLDGTGDYSDLTLAAGAGTSVNTATLIAWVKPSTLGNYRPIIQTRAGGGNRGLSLSSASGNPVTFSWDDVSNEWDAATGLTLSTGKWYFTAAVISSGGVTLYLGNLDGTLSTYTDANSNAAKTIEGLWYIGRD